MQVPARPADEDIRIDTLQALRILDTSAEERFDRLTRIAAKLFSVPIALVSLVDEDRVWFKSAQGLHDAGSPRDTSFCGHAILGDDVFVIADTSRDDRFSDNPHVAGGPMVRFYAGAPLKAADGSTLGTLCLMDKQPREFSEEDQSLLRDLAHMAERELAASAMATMDELTMLSNRRGFEALSSHALELSRRFQKPAALLYFNLDQLDEIKEKLGQDEVERALKAFGQLLKLTFRESDVLGRLDGEAFAVLMTNVNSTELENALERLHAIVENYDKEAKRSYGIDFSFGKVGFDASGHADVGDLMAQADALMFQQRSGKAG
jgi:diguanylate cyclase (GGDEF)-like protein